MKVLVTGANGFVGRRLTRRLADGGHDVTAAFGPGTGPPEGTGTRWVELDVRRPESVSGVVPDGVDAVFHLAGMASGADARRDPGGAWMVNAAGTANLCEVVGERGGEDGPLVIVVSTGEVYGAGPAQPRRETDPVQPVSPYAASKLGAEIAAREVERRTGLRVIVVRPFPHSGAGQDTRFVVPAFARRLLEAKRLGSPSVAVGNLGPVRDLLHVDDVVAAYLRLLSDGEPGATYNVASGSGISIGELFERLARIVEVGAVPRPDPSCTRPVDLPYLVGDPTTLRDRTGWRPAISLDALLREVVRAQAN